MYSLCVRAGPVIHNVILCTGMPHSSHVMVIMYLSRDFVDTEIYGVKVIRE